MNELIQKMNVTCFLKVHQLKLDSISLDIIDFNFYYYHPLSTNEGSLFKDIFFLVNLLINSYICGLKSFFTFFHFFFQIILFMNIFPLEFS